MWLEKNPLDFEAAGPTLMFYRPQEEILTVTDDVKKRKTWGRGKEVRSVGEMSWIVPFSLAPLSPFCISLRIRDVTTLGGARQPSCARAAPI